MLLMRRASSPVARAFALGAMLSANLVAVGVPVLHGLAHRDALGHHHELPLGVSTSDRHHDQHPQQLHSDWVLCDRACAEIAFVVPSLPIAAEAHPRIAVLPAARSSTLRPRAPPALDFARAPPLT
jgi:hypothetical protein